MNTCAAYRPDPRSKRHIWKWYWKKRLCSNRLIQAGQNGDGSNRNRKKR